MRDVQRGWWRFTETAKRLMRPVRDQVTERYPTSSRFLVRQPAMQSLRKQRYHWTNPERTVAPLPYTEASVEAIIREVHDLGPQDRVLEVGSGLGSTLAALVDHGLTNVTGVEINPLAVERMRQLHPQLAEVEMLVGPAEDVLSPLPDDSFSLVVAVRTLQHTHPDSAHLFATLARLAPTVITIDEAAYLGRHTFPWDLATELGRHGMQVRHRQPLRVDGQETNSTVLVMARRTPRAIRRREPRSAGPIRRWLAAS